MEKKLILTALGAFGFGAYVGWAITADIYENRFAEERRQYDELIEDKTEHIWHLQEHIERTWAATTSSNDSESINSNVSKETYPYDPNQISILDPVEEETPEPLSEADDQVPEGETPEETRTNLQKLIDSYTPSSEENENFTRLVESAEEYDKAPPFVIPRPTYAWDEEGENYEKITIMYYPNDRVVLDDDDEPIGDVARLIGWRNLTKFGGESEDPDVVYIRNRQMMTDFEVIKEESQLPLHVKYGMEKEEFRANRAAGLIKLRQEDDDN